MAVEIGFAPMQVLPCPRFSKPDYYWTLAFHQKLKNFNNIPLPNQPITSKPIFARGFTFGDLEGAVFVNEDDVPFF